MRCLLDNIILLLSCNNQQDNSINQDLQEKIEKGKKVIDHVLVFKIENGKIPTEIKEHMRNSIIMGKIDGRTMIIFG